MENVVDGLAGKLDGVRLELADTQIQFENARILPISRYRREDRIRTDFVNRRTAFLPKYSPRKRDLPKRSDYVGAISWLQAVHACIGESSPLFHFNIPMPTVMTLLSMTLKFDIKQQGLARWIRMKKYVTQLVDCKKSQSRLYKIYKKTM